MNILLINPPIREWSKPNVFPLGLGYIASVLLQEKHKVEILDINAFRYSKIEVEDKIRTTQFDIVGIGGIITTYKYTKWLVSIIKKYHPEKKIIIGGSVGSSIPQLIIERNPVDIVCIGEGEQTIKELIRKLENNEDPNTVNSIAYKDKDGNFKQTSKRRPMLNLDKVPFPAWELWPMDIYIKNPVGAPNRNKWLDGSGGNGILSMNLNASRGCPYHCIYCYHDFMGVQYRVRSPENIIQEIKLLYERYGITYFHFTDDEFVMKRDFVYNFCSQMDLLSKKLNTKITWGCTGRVNLMDELIISAMSKAGCISIGYGIESGSQRMLDFIEKQVTVEQAKNAIRLTQEYLGWADVSFMIGYPGEDNKTIKETLNFCKELNLEPEVIFFLTPYPGTKLYDISLRNGLIKDEEEYVLGLGEQGEIIQVNFTDYSNEELFSIQDKLIQELKAWNKIKHPVGG